MQTDKAKEPGAGAAGGLGYAFMQFLNAERRSEIELLLDLVDFDQDLTDADLSSASTEGLILEGAILDNTQLPMKHHHIHCC